MTDSESINRKGRPASLPLPEQEQSKLPLLTIDFPISRAASPSL